MSVTIWLATLRFGDSGAIHGNNFRFHADLPQVIGHGLCEARELGQIRRDKGVDLRLKAVGIARLGQELPGFLWIIGIGVERGVGTTRHPIGANGIHGHGHALAGKDELHNGVFVERQVQGLPYAFVPYRDRFPLLLHVDHDDLIVQLGKHVEATAIPGDR